MFYKLATFSAKFITDHFNWKNILYYYITIIKFCYFYATSFAILEN